MWKKRREQKTKGKFDGKGKFDEKNKASQHTNFKKKTDKKKGVCHVCGVRAYFSLSGFGD